MTSIANYFGYIVVDWISKSINVPWCASVINATYVALVKAKACMTVWQFVITTSPLRKLLCHMGSQLFLPSVGNLCLVRHANRAYCKQQILPLDRDRSVPFHPFRQNLCSKLSSVDLAKFGGHLLNISIKIGFRSWVVDRPNSQQLNMAPHVGTLSNFDTVGQQSSDSSHAMPISMFVGGLCICMSYFLMLGSEVWFYRKFLVVFVILRPTWQEILQAHTHTFSVIACENFPKKK